MLHKQQGRLGMRIRCRLRPASTRRRCRLLGGETAAFCASLVDGLSHLESSLDQVVDHHHHHPPPPASGTVSMRWCADAMRLLKRMQREMLAIFRNADVPVSSSAGDCSCWFEHYMQETAALLDLCNALKAAVSRILRYCMLVDLAAAQQLLLRRGGGAAAAAAALLAVDGAGQPCLQAQAAFRDKMADAKAAVAEAERLGRAIIVSGDGGGGMVVVTLVAKITTSVLCIFVLQALTTAAPPPSTAVVVNGGGGVRPAAIASAVSVSVPELEPWRESLSLIHARFPSTAAVAEHEKVAAAVRDLVVNGGGGGGEGQEEDVLRARSGELREGVEMFECVVDEVFDEVVRGRNEMLGILRDKALI